MGFNILDTVFFKTLNNFDLKFPEYYFSIKNQDKPRKYNFKNNKDYLIFFSNSQIQNVNVNIARGKFRSRDIYSFKWLRYLSI
jgi:hypothetical protein